MPIRDATLHDAFAIGDILNESIAARDSLMIEEPVTEADIRAQMEAFTAREGYLVLEEAGEVVGWGIIKHYSNRSGYRFTAETSVYLRRDCTGRGYGSQLQAALTDRCRGWGYHHLVAKIWAANAASLALHRKFGYELVGIQRETASSRDSGRMSPFCSVYWSRCNLGPGCSFTGMSLRNKLC